MSFQRRRGLATHVVTNSEKLQTGFSGNLPQCRLQILRSDIIVPRWSLLREARRTGSQRRNGNANINRKSNSPHNQCP